MSGNESGHYRPVGWGAEVPSLAAPDVEVGAFPWTGSADCGWTDDVAELRFLSSRSVSLPLFDMVASEPDRSVTPDALSDFVRLEGGAPVGVPAACVVLGFSVLAVSANACGANTKGAQQSAVAISFFM